MNDAQTMPATRGGSVFLLDELDENADVAFLMQTMRAMVKADDRGEATEPVELSADFRVGRIAIAVEGARVVLTARGDDGGVVRLRLVAPEAMTLGAALLAAHEAIEELP
jgi:hypothetical protein